MYPVVVLQSIIHIPPRDAHVRARARAITSTEIGSSSRQVGRQWAGGQWGRGWGVGASEHDGGGVEGGEGDVAGWG